MSSNGGSAKYLDRLQLDLIEIWENEIKKTYGSGHISTEATLVAEFYHYLHYMKSYDVWLEQKFFERKTYDMIITIDKMIIGVIEFKFNPNGKSDYKKDIKKFRDLREWINNETHEDIFVETNPKTGYWSDNYYRINSDVLFVFAVIDSMESPALNTEKLGFEIGTIGILHLRGIIQGNNFEFSANAT